MILGLVISLVLCGALLIATLYYSRRPHVIITPIVDSGMNESISSSIKESSSLEDSMEVSPTPIVDSQVVDAASFQEETDPVLDDVSELLSEVVSIVVSDADVVHEASFEEESSSLEDSIEVSPIPIVDSTIDDGESSNDFVLVETPELYSESVSASMLDSSIAREEFSDEESISILNTAFNLSSPTASDFYIREEDSLEIDIDLSSLCDSQLVIDGEVTVDVTSGVHERKPLPRGFLEIIEKIILE